MTTFRCFNLVLVSVLGLGCATPRYLRGEPARLTASSGAQLVKVDAEEPRQDPVQRLRAFDFKYRDIVFNGYSTGGGSLKLTYPLTRQLQATWNYVALARDYEATNNLGGASRAYWSALRASQKAIASPLDVARLRAVAFAALEAIERKRGHQRLAAALGLCARLNQVSIATPLVASHHQKFHDEYATVLEELNRQDAARDSAATQRGLSIALAVLSLASSAVSGATGDVQLQAESQSQMKTFVAMNSTATHEINAADLSSSQLGSQARSMVGELEAASTQADESQYFAALEAAEVVRRTGASEPCLTALRGWAEGEDAGTAQAMKDYLAGPDLVSDAARTRLARVIADAQKRAARCERLGKDCQ